MYYNGVQTDTSITVVARSTSNGTVTLTCAGQTATATADTAVNYGHVRLEISVLRPDTSYQYTVTIPDNSCGIGNIKTFKSSGNESIVFASCESNTFFALTDVVRDKAKIYISLGDEAYDEDTAFPTNTEALDAAVHDAWRASYREKENKIRLIQNIGFGGVADDHDAFLNDLGDDQADPPADLNTILTNNSRATMTAAQWDTCLGIIGSTLASTWLGNPTTTSSDTDPFYFSFECGDMLVIVPSLIMWTKTEMREIYTGSSAMMNANQLAWLKSQLSDTDKPFKVILSQKSPTVATNNNADSWDGYTDLDTIRQWIHDNSSSFTVPGGVIWGSGDWHSPGIVAYENGVDAATFDHVCVDACPIGRKTDVSDPGAFTAYTRQAIRASEVDDRRFMCYGLINSYGSYIEIEIKLFDGSTYGRARVNAGENKLASIPVSVAI